ncbi:MAG: HDIG domain-containing metalloprotein [Candidatus Omnitrophota bacterium]
MKVQIKNNPALHQIGLIVLVVALIVFFCYLANFSMIIPLLMLFLGIYLFYLKKASPRLLLNCGLLLVALIFTAYAVTEFADLSELNIPIAAVAMLVIILFNDLQLAVLMAFASSVLVALTVGGNLNFMLIFFTGSLMGAYACKDARTRGELIKSGFYVGLIQVVCIILMNPSLDIIRNNNFLKLSAWPLFVNGLVAAFAVIATLKIFEWLFGVVTNFSLLELSDFNQPLLKRMVLECPGTYHHSLIVSNISESAADAIGANTLLARVGAYYHDIGKLEKPEYFTENQMLEGSKHDNLEPNISRLVILNHVKEGIEIGRKNKINEQILDFIRQHHGTGLIYYFYQRAVESAPENEKVDEANFRYPGPKPQSRETAIVMLADSVEGAVRALPEPTATRIEEAVSKIINNKFIDGQLDESNLTLTDIDRIRAVFTRSLGAIYHSRIQYPDKKNGSSLFRKSPDKNPPKSQPDSKDLKKDS